MSEYCKNCYELTEKLEQQRAENEGLRKERNRFKKQYRKNRLDRKQAEQKLERIEEYCKEQNLKADYTACEILRIIEE